MDTLTLQPGDFAPLYVEADEIPLTVLSDLEDAPYTIELDGVEYSYTRSIPIKGHGATLPPFLEECDAEGRQMIIGERGKRYFLFLTSAKTAAAAE